MSLQIAILKVLVSHPEGRATISALNSDLCILSTAPIATPSAAVRSGLARLGKLLKGRPQGIFVAPFELLR